MEDTKKGFAESNECEEKAAGEKNHLKKEKDLKMASSSV